MGFQAALQTYEDKNPRLVLVNGAIGGMTAEQIANEGGHGTLFWNLVDQQLQRAGVTRAQVQAIWLKEADASPRDPFPEHARKLEGELRRIVQAIPERFPNARLAYLSSRSYGGFATTSLSPEPIAYESGFAVKWLIEDQIRGIGALNYDPSKGPVRAPWLSWGAYLWANGPAKRASDGFSWAPEDFADDDGTHESDSGRRKAGRLLLDFFSGDSTTKAWFNRRHADSVSARPGYEPPRPLRRLRSAGDSAPSRSLMN
jgi:hypothetical protein